MLTFKELINNEKLLKGIEEIGYLDPTKIQIKAIPLIKEGKDLIAKSNTGTGKTAAFSLPLIEKIMNDEYKKVLIVAPTRELVMQVYDEIYKYTKYLNNLKTVCVYGGDPINKQIKKLQGGFNILVGTPGRLLDHLRRKTINLKDCNCVVLDEADEMLNMGFRDDIENILQATDNHQTILFSATMPFEIRNLANKYLSNQEEIEVRSKKKTVDKITQYYYDVARINKTDAVKLLLAYHKSDLSIIFCNTKRKVDELVDELNKVSVKAIALHGDIKQEKRTKIMQNFKKSKKMILVASDVAARGIDVDNIDLVINYDLPQDNEIYVHRIGRTGRAGKSGLAITLIKTRSDFNKLKKLIKFINCDIEKQPLPKKADIAAHHNEVFKQLVIEEAKNGIKNGNILLANEIMKEKIDAQTLISALISLANGGDILKDVNVSKSYKELNNPVDLKFSLGRENKLKKMDFINAISGKCNLNESKIGKIDIRRHYTIISVESSDAKIIIEYLNRSKIANKRVEVDYYHKDKKKG